jgi:hypothetical protein
VDIEYIAGKVDSLQKHYHNRDARMNDILAVRRGQISSVYPDFFPEGFSKPMIANFVDVAARDMAEILAPLPSFNCITQNVNSEAEKKRLEKRTMIVNNYMQFSNMQSQMYTGADWYLSYGFLPFVIEADIDTRMPRIRVDNPLSAYPEFDRWNRLQSYTKIYKKTIRELVLDYPEFETQIVGKWGWQNVNPEQGLSMVRYEDNDVVVLYLPDRNNLILNAVENPMGRPMVAIARRPGIEPDDPRGQFDDVLWVQLTRARFSILAMEAAEKSVQAPLVVPNDIQEFPVGPDSIIRTNNPAGVRRVALELPTGAFTEQQVLQNEMRMGARYPEGRSGVMDASIITGQGVQALLGGFDTQIKAGQQILSETMEQVASLCLEMDEKLFPGEKTSNGVHQGSSYEIKYNPEKDIKGNYAVAVRYGLMAGLDPSRALIFSLQALQANLVSREFIMQELPWSMNILEERKRIDIEKMRDTLTQSVSAIATAIPQLAAQGQNPLPIVEKISQVIMNRKNGDAIEDAVANAFKPEEVSPAVEPAVEQGMATPPQAMPPSPEGAPVAPEGAPGQAPAGGVTPNPQSLISQLMGQ